MNENIQKLETLEYNDNIKFEAQMIGFEFLLSNEEPIIVVKRVH